MLKLALLKSLRKGAASRYAVGDPIQAWSPKTRLRGNCHRMLCESGRNAILGRGWYLAKMPVAWIRIKLDLGTVENGNDVVDPKSTGERFASIDRKVGDTPLLASRIETSKQPNREWIPSFIDESSSPTTPPSRPKRFSTANEQNQPKILATLNSSDDLPPPTTSVDGAITFTPVRRYSLRSQYRNLRRDNHLGDDRWMEAGADVFSKSYESRFPSTIAKPLSDSNGDSDSSVEYFVGAYGCVDLSQIPTRIMTQEPLARASLR